MKQAVRSRRNLIAVAIDCWQLQFLEIAELIVNWVAIAIAIASTLTALKLRITTSPLRHQPLKKYSLYETCLRADSL